MGLAGVSQKKAPNDLRRGLKIWKFHTMATETQLLAGN